LSWNVRFSRLIPWITLGLGLLATYGIWLLVGNVIDEREDLRFEHEVDGLTSDILAHLQAYDVIMRGTAGLFLGSERVGRGEFRNYYETLRLPESYSGFLNLGYAVALPTGELPQLVARMRSEDHPRFTIHPDVPGDDHAIVRLIEPSGGVNEGAIGFDGMSSPTGSVAMRRARDTGEASLSAQTPLLRNTETLTSSFLMVLPVYAGGVDPGTVEGRRSAIRGYVFGSLRLNELMGELQSAHTPLVNLTAYDATNGGDATILFQQMTGEDSADSRELVRSIEFGGRTWSLRFTEGGAFRQSSSSEPTMAAIAGVAFSLVLFVLTLFLERIERARRRSTEALLITEKKLRQAQKMEAIGQLTGGVAHDFNNLLQVILGNAELLAEQSEPDSSQRRLAELTQKAAERGAELTNRLLAFARRQALNPRPTDVNSLIGSMETLLHRVLGEIIEIEFTPDPGLLPALVDPAQLESAVLNLCINARDAMPDGGRLSIETRNTSINRREAADFGDLSPGNYVCLTVHDNGIGMDEATVAQAFEPFFTTKDVGKGSGLGLSMVFGFAKQSNGHVKIESGIGQGTAVMLYLPACPENALRNAESAPRDSAEGGNETILMVEDHELVRTNVESLLRSLGYSVIHARDGREALDILRSSRPCDLLFTDLVMPGGVDGHQLAVAARTLRPDLPVLFTSGYGTETVRTNPNSRSIRTLQKPYRRQNLADAIRDLLRLSRSQPAARHRRRL